MDKRLKNSVLAKSQGEASLPVEGSCDCLGKMSISWPVEEKMDRSGT